MTAYDHYVLQRTIASVASMHTYAGTGFGDFSYFSWADPRRPELAGLPFRLTSPGGNGSITNDHLDIDFANATLDADLALLDLPDFCKNNSATAVPAHMMHTIAGGKSLIRRLLGL